MGLFDGTPLERPVICERCGMNIKQCDCEPAQSELEVPELEPAKQRLKVRVEKRKRGKLMTVVSGFSGSKPQLEPLLKALKTRCGAGGTLAELNLELQGDHVERVSEFLRQSGYKLVK